MTATGAKDWASRSIGKEWPRVLGVWESGQELCPSTRSRWEGTGGILAGSKTRRDWFPTVYSSLIFFARQNHPSSCPLLPSAVPLSCAPRQCYHVILFLSVLPSSQSTLTCMSAYRNSPSFLGDLRRDFDPRSSSLNPTNKVQTTNYFEVLLNDDKRTSLGSQLFSTLYLTYLS